MDLQNSAYQRLNSEMNPSKFIPTEADIVEWRQMYEDYQTDWKRPIVESFHPLLMKEDRRLIMRSDEKSFHKNGINHYPFITRRRNSTVYVKRLIHNLQAFDEYVKLATGDFNYEDNSPLCHFAFDFKCTIYRHFRYWRPEEEWNFKMYSPQGEICINKNFSNRGFIDDIRGQILPELIKEKNLMKFLFFDPFEIHFTPLE